MLRGYVSPDRTGVRSGMPWFIGQLQSARKQKAAVESLGKLGETVGRDFDVFRKDWLTAERMNAKAGRDGRLDYLPFRNDIPQRLRVEARGYRTQTGPEFRLDGNPSRTQDFRLQPSPPWSAWCSMPPVNQ